jgi:hypothetical protein
VEQLLQRVNVARLNSDFSALNVNRGVSFFGFNDPWIIQLIEVLPGAVKCRNYKFQFVNPDKLEIHTAPRVQGFPLETNRYSIVVVPVDEDVPDNLSGCARSEAYVRKKHRKKSNALYPLHKNASLLLFSNRKIGDENFKFESDLPAAMKYRQWRAKKRKLM